MRNPKKLVVSHAPFWHIGSSVTDRNYNTILAALPAAIMGVIIFGGPGLGVLCLSVSSAIGWELIYSILSKRENTVGDGNAALIGLLLGMLLPAAVPWWLVISGTFIAILIGKQIFGGIGGNPFNPAALAWAMLSIGWKGFMDFDAQMVHFDFAFNSFYPVAAAKAFGPDVAAQFNIVDLLVGRQVGGAGTTCGLALILGGIYLMARGYVRWEIPVTFILGLVVTAGIFHIANPDRYVGPAFHLLAGYSLFGAFFLAPEDSSSPVNTIPMLLYGFIGGLMTMLIRNIGAYPDGVIYAILVINVLNPLIDKIRPKAIGKVAQA